MKRNGLNGSQVKEKKSEVKLDTVFEPTVMDIDFDETEKDDAIFLLEEDRIVHDHPFSDQGGEYALGGDSPDLESDDDTLEAAHDVGLQLDEDDEHPREINLADDINKAEEYQRTH